jgi:hypothetical protein
MGIITSVLVFILTKRIYELKSITKYNTIDRELELRSKNMELENIVKDFRNN